MVGTLQRAVNLLTREIVCMHTCMYTHVVQGLADQHQSKNLQKICLVNKNTFYRLPVEMYS